MHALIHLTAVFALSSRAASECYFPNGDLSGSDTICNPNALVSSCCYDNQACMSNGLCMSNPHDASKARLHRGTCSDKTWKSGNCPRECLSVANDGASVYSCNQTDVDSYCCFDNCKCNDSKFETFKFTGTDVYPLTIIGEAFTQTHTSTAKPSATSGASSGAATTGATITGTSASSPSAGADTRSSSKSTAIGVGVGVSVGAILLIGAGVFFFWRRKKRASDANNGENPYAGASGAAHGDTKHLAELSNSEASPQYYSPSHSQKYAYYASEPPYPPSSSQSDRRFAAEPTELPSTNTFQPVELPASPPPAPRKDRKQAF